MTEEYKPSIIGKLRPTARAFFESLGQDFKVRSDYLERLIKTAPDVVLEEQLEEDKLETLMLMKIILHVALDKAEEYEAKVNQLETELEYVKRREQEFSRR